MHCTYLVSPLKGALTRQLVKNFHQQTGVHNRLIRRFSSTSEIDDDAIKESARVLKCVCHYSVLELNRDANEQAIKSAYLAKTKQLHPDVCNVESAVEAFRKVAEAYSILSTPTKRNEYDQRFVTGKSNSRNNYASYSSSAYNFGAGYGDEEASKTRSSTEMGFGWYTEGGSQGERRYEYYNGQNNNEYGSQYHAGGYSYQNAQNSQSKPSGEMLTPVLVVGALVLVFASGFGFKFLDKVTGVDQEIKRLEQVGQMDQIRRQKKVAPGAIEKAVAPDGVVSDTPGVRNARFNLLEKDFEKNKIVIGLEINKLSPKYQRLMGEPEHIKIINKFLSKKWNADSHQSDSLLFLMFHVIIIGLSRYSTFVSDSIIKIHRMHPFGLV